MHSTYYLQSTKFHENGFRLVGKMPSMYYLIREVLRNRPRKAFKNSKKGRHAEIAKTTNEERFPPNFKISQFTIGKDYNPIGVMKSFSLQRRNYFLTKC